jgi:mono/diheme cytochrome c family protein
MGGAAIWLAACGASDPPHDATPGDSGTSEGPWEHGVFLPPEDQRTGDPEAGRRALLNGDFMTCGVPYALYSNPALSQMVSEGLGSAATGDTLPGREGHNATLPYSLNAFISPDGAEVVNNNCLACHGGKFDGELIIGLGNATADFTEPLGGTTEIPLTDEVLDSLGLSQAEKDNLIKITGRARALAPYSQMRTVGMNPAEMFAVVLMVHHDRDTLAWSDEPLVPMVIYDREGRPMPDAMVTSDPPPWWRAHKKNALFYNGMARGDHRGTMALATSVCVDTVERAHEVDEMFVDIQAFVSSIRAPVYPRQIDGALAAEGKPLFERNCAGCHGTYGATDAEDTYPNLLIPLDVIGTDPVVAEAGTVHAPDLVEWYNTSFYGQITRMVPDDPFPGYMPPPLDGIWATAPYFHNGSVPTIELVLNSSERPAVWRRVDLDSTNFDEEALGWPYEVLETSQANAPPAEQKYIYDTSYFSQSNAGHTFGDHLSAEERRAVIEYLKTL